MKTVEPSESRLGLTLLPGFLLLAGLLATALAIRYAKEQADAASFRQFDFTCGEIQEKIVARINAHEQILRSGAAFFEGADNVSRQEWRLFTAHQKIEQLLPGIQGLGFALLIPREKLAHHIQEIRAEGFPDYQVRPVGEREFYSSIIYLEPFTGRNLRAFSYDMLSEPVRRAAMERTRDQDMATLSGKVRLLQETDQDVQAGTLMFVAAYRQGMPIDTVDQRRAALLGWVYSPYRMTDLMCGILGRADWLNGRRIHLKLFDGKQATPATLLYDSQPAATQSAGNAARLNLQRRLVVAGRTWTLHFTSIDSPTAYGTVWVVLLGGTTISLLLGGLVFNLLNTRFKAERIAHQLTQVLRESLARFQLANQAAFHAIWDWNLQTNILWWNETFQTIFGYRVEEIEPGIESWTNRIHPEDLDRVKAGIYAVIDSGKDHWHDSYRFRRKDGMYAEVEDQGSIARDASGRPLRMIGAIQDITERKLAEARIQQQLDELTRWYNVMLKREGRVQEVKKEVNELLAQLGQPPRYTTASKKETPQ
jgi:PAS domain S-box-containing protein